MKLITNARLGDAPRIFEILVQATSVGGIGYYPEQILKDWHRGRSLTGMREFLMEERVFTLHDEDEIKGFIHITDNEVVGLYVHPDDHGKGYGGSLLFHGLNEIRERPVVVRATLNAVDFYAKFGFKKVKFGINRRNERDIYVWIMEHP